MHGLQATAVRQGSKSHSVFGTFLAILGRGAVSGPVRSRLVLRQKMGLGDEKEMRSVVGRG